MWSKFVSLVQRRWPWFAGAGVLVVGGVGVSIAAYLGMFAPAPVDVHGGASTTRLVSDGEVEPDDESSQEESPQPVIEIPAAQTMPYTEVWDPPDGGEYFWQVVDPENGYPEIGGTSYLLAHACFSGLCAGDEALGLVTGDAFTYKGELYQVEEKLEVSKSQIGEQDIWEHRKGRLVIITCIIEPDTGEVNENAILVASPA